MGKVSERVPLCQMCSIESVQDVFKASNLLSHMEIFNVIRIKMWLNIFSDNNFYMYSTYNENELEINNNDYVNKCNMISDVTSCTESSMILCSESLDVEKPKNDLNLPDSSQCVGYLTPESRTRNCSECSIESTDSGSFIVFDENCDLSCNALEGTFLSDTESDVSDFFVGEEDCSGNLDDDDNYDDDDDDDEDEDDNSEDCEYDDDEDRRKCDTCTECNRIFNATSTNNCNTVLENAEAEEANTCKSKSQEAQPLNKENKGIKKVQFSSNVQVHKMIAWDYAYRAARLGPWMQMARDRAHFAERIHRLSSTISPILLESHRKSVYNKLYL